MVLVPTVARLKKNKEGSMRTREGQKTNEGQVEF